jgi:integrase
MYYERKRGLASSTINEQITFISDFYETLIDNDYLEKNPVRKRKHKIRVHRDSPPVTFSEEEVIAILDYAKKLNTGIHWFEFYLTAFLTGLRRNELRELAWQSINLAAKLPLISIYKTKTGNPKVIPIHPELRPHLGRLETQSKNGLVFPNFNGKILPSNKPTGQLKEICNELRIPKEKAHLHTFRRTFASLSKMKGLDSEAIQKIGAWKDRKVMERHYVNLPPEWAVEKYFKINYLPK